MKTEVIMKRKLFNSEISQKSKSEFFSATDLVRAGSIRRKEHNLLVFNMSAWLNQESTKTFINALNAKYGECLIKGRGRSAQTWVHPLLFIDMALAIHPDLKVEVYEWLYDHLIKNRNDSGDNYKLMCGSLYERHGNVRTFPKYITAVANAIRESCGVKNWQEATEQQLEKRKMIQYDISAFADVMNNNDEAVRLGLLRHNKIGGKSIQE